MATKKTNPMEMLFSKMFIKQEIADIGIFKKGKDIEKHIKNFEDKIKELNISEDDMFKYFIKTIDEDVLLEMEASPKYDGSYKFIVQSLKENYKLETTKIKLCSSLLDIKQKQTQSTKEFLSEIKVSAMKIFPNESHQERGKMMLMAFVEGLLNNKHSAILKQLKPTTLEEAFDLIKNENCKYEETIMKIDNQQCSDMTDEIEYLKRKLDLALKKIDELDAKLTSQQNRMFGNEREKKKKLPNNVICFYCNKEGHFKRNCPKLRNCEICGKQNHLTENCFFKSKQSRPKRFRNVELESESSVATEDISEMGENIVENHTNDAYIILNSAQNDEVDEREDKKQRITAQNNQKKKKTYQKEILNWANYIEGNGAKPRKQLQQERMYEPTLISRSNPEKARYKPVIPAQIEANTTKNIFIDSGCECNIVDQSFLFELAKTNRDIKIVRCKAKNLSCANKSLMEVLGYTRLKITIGGKQMKLKFAIVESIFPNILIGMKSMTFENISIISEENCIRIDGNISVPFVSRSTKQNLN